MDPDQDRCQYVRLSLPVSVCLPACLSVCLLQDTFKKINNNEKAAKYLSSLIHTAKQQQPM